MVGFGLMTDCTNSYGCTETGCTPCADTENWVNAGGIAQLVLAGMGVVVLVLKIKRRPNLAITGAVLLATSVLTMVGTTWRAQESYCQPDAPGYISSDCSIGD